MSLFLRFLSPLMRLPHRRRTCVPVSSPPASLGCIPARLVLPSRVGVAQGEMRGVQLVTVFSHTARKKQNPSSKMKDVVRGVSLTPLTSTLTGQDSYVPRKILLFTVLQNPPFFKDIFPVLVYLLK